MAKSTARGSRRRSAGEGSVYPFRGGYRGAVTWTDHESRRHRRVVTGRTVDETRAKLDELRRELRLGTLTSGPPETVGAYLADWIIRDRPRVRPSTWLAREMHVRVYLIPALGRIPLARLSAADVEAAMSSFL